MKRWNLSRGGQWAVAGVIAFAGVLLGARSSDASSQRLNATIISTNPNCTQDANGNGYWAFGVAVDANNFIQCTAGQSALFNSSGYGSTAQSVCGFHGAQAVKQYAIAIAQDASTGLFGTMCAGQSMSFTSTSSCTFTPAVQGSCGPGNTVEALSTGVVQ